MKRTRMAAIFNRTAARRKGCKGLFSLQKRVHRFEPRRTLATPATGPWPPVTGRRANAPPYALAAATSDRAGKRTVPFSAVNGCASSVIRAHTSSR